MPTDHGPKGASDTPRVSIIMPVFNGAAYLGAAIDSVRGQTVADWELLVIDDGSTDDTAAVLARYANDARVHILRQAQGGPARARNRALANARGELIAFLDADDVWEPDYLARMTATLRSHPNAAAAYSGWKSIDEAGHWLPQRVLPYDGDPLKLEQEISWKNSLVPSGVVARRALLEAAGGFDVDEGLATAEDWEMWLRLLQHGPFACTPGYELRYRHHRQSFSAEADRAARGRLAVVEKHFGTGGDDPAAWPPERQRATANIHLAWAIAYFVRQETERGIELTVKAVTAWPGFLDRPELYYELGAAFQDRGRRGAAEGLRLEETTALIRRLIFEVWPVPAPYTRRDRWGYACLVLSQLAYQAGERAASRRLAATALVNAAGRHKLLALRRWLRATVPEGLVQAARRARGPA